MSPKGPVRSNSKHQNPPRLPAAICLSMVLHNAVEHVVPAARRRAGPGSEDGGALVSVERERDEDVPEHGLRTKSVGVHLLLICSRGDFEERGVNGVVRREPPGESAFDPLCNALEPVGLELPKLGDGSLVGKPRAVDGAAFVLEPLDGRDHALYGGDEPVGDGECVAQHAHTVVHTGGSFIQMRQGGLLLSKWRMRGQTTGIQKKGQPRHYFI